MFVIQDLRDFGGIKFHMTTNLRKTEIGVFTLGSSSRWSGLFIPPFVENLNFDFSSNFYFILFYLSENPVFSLR